MLVCKNSTNSGGRGLLKVIKNKLDIIKNKMKFEKPQNSEKLKHL